MNDPHDELYDFATGRGKWPHLGDGMRTYPGRGEREQKLHDGCLKLQEQGRLKIVSEEDGVFIWKDAVEASE